MSGVSRTQNNADWVRVTVVVVHWPHHVGRFTCVETVCLTMCNGWAFRLA
jgi:hypothetical protein